MSCSPSSVPPRTKAGERVLIKVHSKKFEAEVKFKGSELDCEEYLASTTEEDEEPNDPAQQESQATEESIRGSNAQDEGPSEPANEQEIVEEREESEPQLQGQNDETRSTSTIPLPSAVGASEGNSTGQTRAYEDMEKNRYKKVSLT